MIYNFNQVLDRSKLSTCKWEMELKGKGNPDLLCMGTAEMDFRTSDEIIAALQEVVDNGHFGYPFKRDSYYEAIIGYFERHCNWKIEKDWIANSVAIYPSFQGLIEGLSKEGMRLSTTLRCITFLRKLSPPQAELRLKIH